MFNTSMYNATKFNSSLVMLIASLIVSHAIPLRVMENTVALGSESNKVPLRNSV